MKLQEIQTSTIIICDYCKGSGKREQSRCTDYHHNEYDYWDIPCSRCKGLGRLKQNTIEILQTLTEKDLELRKE